MLHPLWADGVPFQPFPHQTQVWQRAVAAFPQPFLFCDEVGLGKTIEAGLVLRTLILRGVLNRVLLIAPRSLIRQWLEELREKSPTAWFFDGHCLRDVDGRVRWTERPWEEDGIIIVSRHLIARAIAAPVSSPSSAHGMRCWWTKPMRPGAACLEVEAGRISCSDCCRHYVPEPISLPLAADSNTDATRPTRGARLVTAVWTRRSGVGTLVQPRRLSRIL